MPLSVLFFPLPKLQNKDCGRGKGWGVELSGVCLPGMSSGGALHFLRSEIPSELEELHLG